jgi:hypothetical protein
LLAWGFAGDGQEELEFWGELVFGVESVGEVDSSNTTVGVDLHSKLTNQLLFSNMAAILR